MNWVPRLIAAAVLISSAAMAQYPRNDPYDRGGIGGSYERRDGGGAILRSVERDLERALSRPYVGGHERNRLDQALRSLNDFERNASRGKFDRHALDKAIERVDDVVRRNRIDPRERNVLIGDVNRLREFRASGGGYNYYRR